MSVYAFESVRREVVAVWPAPVGSRAQVVTSVPVAASEADAGSLCAALTRLSEALWETYVRPASAADDERERLRREDERLRFDGVVAAVRSPHLPDEFGALVVSHSAVEESAHRLGRVLHTLADAALADALTDALADAVVAEVGVEVDAVTRAELGDLSGRAVQAVALDRLDVSPIQVAAVDEVLRADPVGSGLLTAAVDPAAACVAAAHWLAAAAVVAADASGVSAGEVFAEADHIQPVSIGVPSAVVERIVEDGQTPREVVLGLLRAAVAAGEGQIVDLAGIVAERARLEELVRPLPVEGQEAAPASDPVRMTLLDPRRPARDLLEHLLDGIGSCWLLYADDAYDNYDDGDEQDDEVAEEFADVVRGRAADTRSRLI